MKFNALGAVAALALSMGCSDASSVDVGSDDAINSNIGADGGMVVQSDGGESRLRLALTVSADRVYPNRTFAVVASVRAGARAVLGQDIYLSVDGHASLVNSSRMMQTVCVGNAPEDSFENQTGFLTPVREGGQMGMVMLNNDTNCATGYHDSGLRFALVHTQTNEPDAEVYIGVTGTTANGGAELTNRDRIQLTPTANPAGDSLAFADRFFPAEVSAGQDFPGVVLPQTTHAYGLPCMPSTEREPSSIAGCTVETNAGRAVPAGESILINQATVPRGIAGALVVGAEMNNGLVVTRGMLGNDPLALTHLGGGAYLSTFRAGTNSGVNGTWAVNMYGADGRSVDVLRLNVPVN